MSDNFIETGITVFMLNARINITSAAHSLELKL